MTALRDLTSVLKLEVEDTPAGLTNLIQNPNGELGGWGWITPLASSVMAGSTALAYTRTVSGASYFTSELLPIAAGQFAAAAYAQRSAGNAYHKVQFEWYNASKAFLSASTQSALIAPSATLVTNVAPIVAPAGTVYMKLRIDLYTSGGANPAGSHSFAFTNATVASAATSGALGTFRTNLVPNPSFESNVSGWNPYWYGGRETMLAQSATFAQSGTKSMSMTRPFTSGTLGASSAPIPVTGGADYIASLYSRAGSVARSFDLYLAWYTSAGVFISQNIATATNATGAWTRHSLIATAPAAAAYVRIEFATTAATTPAAEIHYVDAVLLEKSTVLGTYFDGSTAAGGGFTYAWVGTRTRTNLCTNPSAETNATGWSSDDGLFTTATVARVTSPAGADRTACVSLTKLAGTGTGLVLRGSNPNRVTPASWTEEYVISASVRAAATARSVGLGVAYLDSGGNLLGAQTFGSGSDVVGAWTRYSARITLNKSGMPSAVYVVPYIIFSGPATSEVHYVDAVAFEKTLSSGGGDYFDGAKAASAPYSFAWTGTADASTSTESGPLTSTATQSNLSYIPPVSYVNILGPTSEIKVVRPVFDVGTLSAVVREVALDPATATLLRPGRRVRLTALNSATAAFEVLFAGKADRAHVEYDLTRTDEKQATIELTAIDGTQDVANVTRSAGVGTIPELPYVLEDAGVPWNCDGSGNQVPGAVVVSTVENASALDQVALTRDSVSGYAWITKEGIVTAYTDRTLDYYGNGTATMDEDDYSKIATSFDTDDCINEVLVNYLRFNPSTLETTEIPYGPFQDAASIKQWRAHQATFRVQGISEAAVATFAAAILTANATPAFRVNGVTVPIRDTADVTELKALIDQYAKVNVINTAKAINVTHRVQTITHEISPPAYPGALAKWIMTLGFNGSTSAVASPVPTPSPSTDVPAADGVWITPTLGNGWSNFGGAFAPVAYMRKNGMVYLKGFIGGGTYGNPIFTLPAGYRPAATNVFSAITDRPTTGAASTGTAHTHLIPAVGARVDVQASGAVQVAAAATGAYNNTYQSLSGICFPAEQ